MTAINTIMPVRWNKNEEKFNVFVDRVSPKKIVDYYDDLLRDYFLISNPRFRFVKNYETEWHTFFEQHCAGHTVQEVGEWFYFPWSGELVHYLPDALHQELRTARNKNLITAEEQKRFYNSTVGIAGLSVGSHAALTIAMMGGARRLKLADGDVLSGSNLNRVRYDFTKIGQHKAEIAAQHIFQLNPFAEVELFAEGLSAENIDSFLSGDHPLDVFVEEMDNLEMKIRTRIAAKKFGIPVVMATDNGDNIIVDIERYDLHKDLKIFNGIVGDLTLDEFRNFPPQDLPKLAAKIVGPELITKRMLDSLSEVGKTLYSWPQLGDAASLCGVTVAYLVRKIVLGEKIVEGKVEVSLDKVFNRF